MYLFLFSISLIGLLFLIINTVKYWFYKKKISSKVYNIICYYLLTSCVIEIACHILGFLEVNSNFFLSHFIFHCEYLFLSSFYYKIIHNKWVKNAIVFVSVLFYISLFIQYYQDPSVFWRFNLFEILFISITLIIFGLTYLYSTLGEQDTYYNISIGLILFMLCSSVIYISGNYDLVLWQNPFIDIWIFNYLFFIIYQIFITKQLKVFLRND